MTKSQKNFHYLYLDLAASTSKKSCNFPSKGKFNFFAGFSHINFILKPCKSISSFISSSFCFFYFLFYLKIFIIKNCWYFWKPKIIFSSGTISFFGFSFSITLSSSSTRRSPLIVCVIFACTFDEVLAVKDLFGKYFLQIS